MSCPDIALHLKAISRQDQAWKTFSCATGYIGKLYEWRNLTINQAVATIFGRRQYQLPQESSPSVRRVQKIRISQ